MIAESPQEQPINFVRSSYSIENQSLDSAIYANRFYNDQLLGEIIAMTKKNNQLNHQIEDYKSRSPKFLGSWWQTNNGPQSITVYLNKTQKLFNDQINLMVQTIRQYQQQKELSALQLEKELQEQQLLKQKKTKLQQQLTQLKERNDQQEQELESIVKEKQKFYQTIRQLQSNKGILQLQHSIHCDHVSKIQAATKNCSFQQSQQKYYQKLKQFLKHSMQRKRYLQDFNSQSQNQLDKINSLLENLEAERKGNQLRKQSIVSKHLQLNKLKEGLAVSEQKRKQAHKRKAQLEKMYCEEEMQKLAFDYHELQEKCDNLLGKTLNLTKQSIENTKIKPLETIINKNHAE